MIKENKELSLLKNIILYNKFKTHWKVKSKKSQECVIKCRDRKYEDKRSEMQQINPGSQHLMNKFPERENCMHKGEIIKEFI